MRSFSASAAMLLATVASAQTVNTVQNGDWDAPSTWSCNCVPGPGSSPVIMHSVTVNSDLLLNFPTQVTSAGEMTTPFPVNVVVANGFTVEGHVFIAGTVNIVGGPLDISGFFEVAGNFSADGPVAMDGGTMVIEGNFTNYSSITGEGSICVYDVTTNEGTINGTVDLCDLSPTTTTAPIVDVNNGVFEPTVTFCTNSSCVTGIGDHMLATITLSPNPANDRVQLGGLGEGASYAIIDATGRTCARGTVRSDRADVDVTALVRGTYRMQVRTVNGSRTLPFLIVR